RRRAGEGPRDRARGPRGRATGGRLTRRAPGEGNSMTAVASSADTMATRAADAAPHDAPHDALSHLELLVARVAVAAPPGAVVTRPHPLVVAVRREDLTVLLAPAAAWDHARDVLRPWTASLA